MERATADAVLSFEQLEADLACAGAPALSEGECLERLRTRLEEGRRAIRARFERDGDAARVHTDHARLMDALLRGLLDYASRHVYPTANPTAGEEITVLAVGGYGRAELAPHSDIDLLFLYPYKRTPLVEQLAEFLLLKLWDAKLKVGHATRSVDECLRFAEQDLTIFTGLLESRPLWGSTKLAEEFARRFWNEAARRWSAEFVEAKLAERDARHDRMGDSRYLLEPNIKEGKGGLRDLHTLMWLGRFLYRVREPADLVAAGVLSREDLRLFLQSRRFLWTVRCHLHYLTDRAEERLTFDLQPQVARRMGYRDRGRIPAVERFMKHYYVTARNVGNLTRIVCAALEEQHKRRPPISFRFGFGRRRIGDFRVLGSRLTLASEDLFARRPRAMLELFHLAQERGLDIHPDALKAVVRSLRRVDDALRHDPEANRLFLEMLTSRRDPALTLTRMNEAGLLGRFIPAFGRVVAQRQHTLYHIYTTDEHTIRAIDVLHRIEQGELAAEHPLSRKIMPQIRARTELYLATFLHDIGKGRQRPHSEVGAEIAARLCPRLGLDAQATETVVWLVRHHLLMSDTAFRRNIDDPQTVRDFVRIVQSPERLRLLLVLTVADIRAVGPGVWNGWKGQLLRDLYGEAMAAMTLGDVEGRRAARAQAARLELADRLRRLSPPWSEEAVARWLERHEDAYWLSFPVDQLVRHAERVRRAEESGERLVLDFRIDRFGARTELMVQLEDRPGLFSALAGALALSGVSILDARIFTTRDGAAFDFIGFQDASRPAAVEDPSWLARIRRNLEQVLAGTVALEEQLARRRAIPPRTEVFRVQPRVVVDNRASRTHTVIEVQGRDRVGLLYELTKVLREHAVAIKSAHIATYGERVVDVFYVKDLYGMKLSGRARLERLEKDLMAVLARG